MRPGREAAERLLSVLLPASDANRETQKPPRTNRYARCLEERDTYKRILGTKESEKLAPVCANGDCPVVAPSNLLFRYQQVAVGDAPGGVELNVRFLVGG